VRARLDFDTRMICLSAFLDMAEVIRLNYLGIWLQSGMFSECK